MGGGNCLVREGELLISAKVIASNGGVAMWSKGMAQDRELVAWSKEIT